MAPWAVAAAALALVLAPVAAFRTPKHALKPLSAARTAAFSRRAPLSLPAAGSDVAEEVKVAIESGYPDVSQRFRKSTKQLATLGPASANAEMLEKLFLAGADVFRLNFSHGKHEEKRALVEMIRALEAKYNHPIAVLADLQGPKLRVDTFEADQVTLVEGQSFTFDSRDEPGDASRVRLPHPEILSTLRPGDLLLLDDGKLRMRVTGNSPGLDAVETTVEVGGKLSNRKGVNTPTVVLPISPITPKDREDLAFALTCDVDWVALSFVQTPNDVLELRELVGDKARIMAKLEKPAAIDALDDIVQLSDGIMVARGDLGVEMNPWDVPVIQKRIVDTCRLVGKPVVVATQMLESMIDNPTPTRAEASDVATAIYDGADAVMLSAESAAGRFPEESVRMQQRIINRVERDEGYRDSLRRAVHTPLRTATDAITSAARVVAETISAKAMVVFTSKGTTVLRAAKSRPGIPILACTSDEGTARQLALVSGVYPVTMDRAEEDDLNSMLRKACSAAKDKGLVSSPSDLLVCTAGLPFGTPGAANVLRVVPARGPDDWDERLERPVPDEWDFESEVSI